VIQFLQHLVNGLSLGTIYALIALGYTMVYGVLKLINFAHGDVYMVGAFAGYYVAGTLGVREEPTFGKAVAVTLGAMIVCGVLGFAIERFAYRPLRTRPRLTALITAIGVSFLLEYGFQLPSLQEQARAAARWVDDQGYVVPALSAAAPRLPSEFPPGPAPRVFPDLVERKDWTFFHSQAEDGTVSDLRISSYDLIGFGVAFALMLALQWIVYRTRFGRAMRAVSFDPQVAGLMGIPVNRIISWTFVLGSALAAAAGIINAMSRHRIEPLFGLMSGLKAFVAAVLGGIGSVPGAMVGGLVLGLAEEYVAGYTVSSYRDAIAFAVLIVVLLFRPEGLFGRARVEKV
jgi:branched-chain amino acid transport system permease protein